MNRYPFSPSPSPRRRRNPAYSIKTSASGALHMIVDASGTLFKTHVYPTRAAAEAALAALGGHSAPPPPMSTPAPAPVAPKEEPPASAQWVSLAGLDNVYLPAGWVVEENEKSLGGEHDMHSHKNTSSKLSVVWARPSSWRLHIRHDATINWNSIWGNSPAPASTDVWTFTLVDSQSGAQWLGGELRDYRRFNDFMHEAEWQVDRLSTPIRSRSGRRV